MKWNETLVVLPVTRERACMLALQRRWWGAMRFGQVRTAAGCAQPAAQPLFAAPGRADARGRQLRSEAACHCHARASRMGASPPQTPTPRPRRTDRVPVDGGGSGSVKAKATPHPLPPLPPGNPTLVSTPLHTALTRPVGFCMLRHLSVFKPSSALAHLSGTVIYVPI